MDQQNIILATDSYKLTHYDQYPKGTERVYSYFESRAGATYPQTCFFGLQPILRNYLADRVVTRKRLEEADGLARAHFGRDLFNYEGWEYILNEHNGYLPLRIKAVAEGSMIPTGNVLMTVENTDPNCWWLTNAVESVLTHVWYPSTVATLSLATLAMIGEHLEKTASSMEGLPFMLHDFGYRGASSHESAALGGAGHLIGARGTDTLPAMILAVHEYGANLDELAFSVPATEHSVMTARGPEGEFEVVDQLLADNPTGILSVVGDSYDIYAFAEKLGTDYYGQIMQRDGKLVLRPDSGDPVETVVKLSGILAKHFGFTENSKGYAELNPHVGILWGDGLEPKTISEILDTTAGAGFAADNYVFGMGGGLLQKINRDTQRFAFKCSAQMREGEWVDIYKDPLDSSKVSKRGRLRLEYNKSVGEYSTTPLYGVGEADDPANLLKTVFLDGSVTKLYDFGEVRANAAA